MIRRLLESAQRREELIRRPYRYGTGPCCCVVYACNEIPECDQTKHTAESAVAELAIEYVDSGKEAS